ILDAALQAGYAFPNSCRAGGCASCKCKVDTGSCKERLDSSYVLSSEDVQEGYVLGCQTMPRSDLVLSLPHVHSTHVPWSCTARVVQAELLCASVLHLVLRTDTPIAYDAGRYASVLWNTLPQRSYSFATSMGQTSTYDA